MTEPLAPTPTPAPTAPAPRTTRPAPRRESGWLREVRQWAVVILIILGIHSFLVKPFYIPSESMMTTLLVGDRLIVSKFPYGFSYLSPSIPVLPRMQGRLFGRLPERGDIIVLKSPSDGADWIKRVIALPGDTVELADGRVVLNGLPLSRVPVPDAEIRVTANTDCRMTPQYRTVNTAGEPVCRLPTFRETLPGGRSYQLVELIDSPRDRMRAVTVPPGHVFLLGDNRDNSLDSRVPPELGGLGLVPVENIVGRAEFTTFSLDGTTTLNPVTWFTSLRGERALRSLR